MRGAPVLSQHIFPAGPAAGDLWAACSPPAPISSARANLLTPPVWRLLTGRWPRLVWRRNTAKSLDSSAVTKLQPLKGRSRPPGCQSGTRSPSVRLSALPGCAAAAGGGGAQPLLRLSPIPLWGTRGYYKAPEDFPVPCANGLCCGFNMPDRQGAGNGIWVKSSPKSTPTKAAGSLERRCSLPRRCQQRCNRGVTMIPSFHECLNSGSLSAGSCHKKGRQILSIKKSLWDRPGSLLGGRGILAVGVPRVPLSTRLSLQPKNWR